MTKRRRRRPRGKVCANNLWWYRKRMGFSQREAAQVVGYFSHSDISRLERGDRLPSLLAALKLEILYRVPVAFLFSDLYAQLKATIREREGRLPKRAHG